MTVFLQGLGPPAPGAGSRGILGMGRSDQTTTGTMSARAMCL